MTVASSVHYDMYDREIYASPYDVYRRLRDEAPLYYNEEYDFYAVSRHADIVRVLGDRETFISGKGGIYELLRHPMELPPGLFIFEDPPVHTMHRGIVSRLFTPRAVAGLEHQIRDLLTEIIDGLVGRERFDFTKEFALRLPVQVIGMLVGVPKEDQPSLLETFQKNMHETADDPERQALEGILDAARWFNEYLDWREKNPTDDVMTQLLNHEFEDETGRTRTLAREEIVTYLTLITSAGSDTTATAISWAGSILSDHPDQRRELVHDPSLIPGAVEEILRYESPAYQNARWATTAVEFDGGTVPAESIVVMLPGAGNHDDRKFDDPERFDIHRPPSQILTFGFGPHFCLGANLARMETRLALEAILPRIPEWMVDHEGARLTGGIDTRGWERLPVTVG
ncbi:MAG TPA: cytochrome P450 [Acidimicrobiales bacterium]